MDVILTGSDFVAGATVNVSGSGVTVSNVQVVSVTAITATFQIAATVSTGARDVTETTSSGTSGKQTVTVTAASQGGYRRRQAAGREGTRCAPSPAPPPVPFLWPGRAKTDVP